MAAAPTDRLGRDLAVWLAAMALVLQALAPSGFMVARTGDGPTIAICTGHGPLLAHPGDPAGPGKSRTQREGGLCVFAGHGGVAPALTQTTSVSVRVAIMGAPPSPVADLLPGRGLAAPPPPSQGPPILSI